MNTLRIQELFIESRLVANILLLLILLTLWFKDGEVNFFQKAKANQGENIQVDIKSINGIPVYNGYLPVKIKE